MRGFGRGRKWAVLGVAGVLATAITIPAISFADSSNGCDFQQPPAGQPHAAPQDDCTGPLTGSTFAGGDGNLTNTHPAFGSTDWVNVAGRNVGPDLQSGSNDNSFGKGAKEDDPNIDVVSGSIPPNKSDLTRFYEASEFASNNNYLYLAWERTNVLGSANFDFEINQKTQPDLTTTGAKTLVRTPGDLLVTFDFDNGGGTPTIGLLTWITSGTCFASGSTAPCWGNQQTLGPSVAVAAVNTDPVTDPIATGSPSLPALTFGETAINLTAANVFSPTTCQAFGSAFVRSRASSSFTAEIKDFIAPIPVNISNCGEVKIIKETDPRGLNQSFGFTSTMPNPATGVTPVSPLCTTDSTPSAFSLNDNGNTNSDNSANTEDCKNLLSGNYTVTENTEPAAFTLESLTCTATTGSSGVQHPVPAGSPPSQQADISVAPGGLVTCTYVNQGTGAIQVTKTGKDVKCTAANTPSITYGTCTGNKTAALKNATFSITVNGSTVSQTTDINGKACFSGLAIGTAYTVTESTPPTGFARDNATKSVTVTKAATCATGSSPDGVSFTDSPLTDITAGASAEVPGATNSTINCADSGGHPLVSPSPSPSDPASFSKTGLVPGVYTCTINIDP